MSSLSFSPKTNAGLSYERAIDLLSIEEAPEVNLTFARLEVSLAAQFFDDQRCAALRDSLYADIRLGPPWRLRTDTWEKFKFDCRLDDPKSRSELQTTVDTFVRFGLIDLAMDMTVSVKFAPDLTDAERADLVTSIAAEKITTKSELLLKIEDCLNRGSRPEAEIYLTVAQKNGFFEPKENLKGSDALPLLHALARLEGSYQTLVKAKSPEDIGRDDVRMVRFAATPLIGE